MLSLPIIRAVYEWILDNQLTPYLLVKASYPMVQVPNEFVSEGKIILNLAPSAIRNLHMGNDEVEFSARFGGKPRNLHVPVGAILAIYAKENGEGMVFGSEPGSPDPEGGGEPKSSRRAEDRPNGRPTLKVVK